MFLSICECSLSLSLFGFRFHFLTICHRAFSAFFSSFAWLQLLLLSLIPGSFHKLYTEHHPKSILIWWKQFVFFRICGYNNRKSTVSQMQNDGNGKKITIFQHQQHQQQPNRTETVKYILFVQTGWFFFSSVVAVVGAVFLLCGECHSHLWQAYKRKTTK